MSYGAFRLGAAVGSGAAVKLHERLPRQPLTEPTSSSGGPDEAKQQQVMGVTAASAGQCLETASRAAAANYGLAESTSAAARFTFYAPGLWELL